MSKEMKIGAGLGLVLVLISSWFFVSRSNDEQAVPLTGETVSADGAKPADAAKKGEEKDTSGAAKPSTERRGNGSRDTAAANPGRPGTRPSTPADESAARTASTTGTPADAAANRTAARRPPLSPAETASPSAQPPTRSGTMPLNNNGTARDAGAGTTTPVQPAADAGTTGASPPPPTPGTAETERNASAAPRTAQSNERSSTAPGISPGIFPPRPGTSAAPASSSPGSAAAQPAAETPRTSNPLSTGTSPSAATGAQPASAQPGREHVVQSGDTFAGLAERYYGSQRHMGYLIAANKHIKDPGRLSIGQKLTIPPAPQGTEAKPADAAKPIAATGDGRTYVVQAGDSFYDIAAKALGAGARWPEIYERNKDVVGNNPANLTVGQVLELPPRE